MTGYIEGIAVRYCNPDDGAQFLAAFDNYAQIVLGPGLHGAVPPALCDPGFQDLAPVPLIS